MRNLTVGICFSAILVGCGGGGVGSTSTTTVSSSPAAPTLTFTANKTEILSGQTVTLTWSSNSSSCTASGNWSGAKSASGTETFVVNTGSTAYSLNCSGVSSTVNVVGVPYITNVITSDVPDYTNNVISSSEYIKNLRNSPYAISFANGTDNKLHAFNFPLTFDFKGNLPGLELVETSPNKFTFKKFFNEPDIWSVRSWAPIKLKNLPNSTSLVLADHGQEIGSQETWNLGYVWSLTDEGQGFNLKKLSNNRAFNHSVAVGDITSDQLEDLLVLNMGVRGGSAVPLQQFTQQTNNNLVQDFKLAATHNPSQCNCYGGGAVAIGDLNNDKRSELIEASYGVNPSDTVWNTTQGYGAFRIWEQDSYGNYKVVKTLTREGNYQHMKGSQVTLIDFENDGDSDLVITLEGTCTNNPNEYNCMALEFYRNDGNLVFTRMTDVLLTKSKFETTSATGFLWGSIKVVDINNDGYLDLYLEYGSAAVYAKNNTFDLGNYILKNEKGKGFNFMTGVKEFMLNFTDANSVPSALRFMDNNNGTTRLFGFNYKGEPVVVAIQAGK